MYDRKNPVAKEINQYNWSAFRFSLIILHMEKIMESAHLDIHLNIFI